MTELMYMASPYTALDMHGQNIYKIEQRRAAAAVTAAAKLTTEELIIFSPIAHSYQIAMKGQLPGKWEFWNYFDEKIISVCDRFAILALNNWRQSTGIKNEIAIAIKYNLTIELINPQTYTIGNFSNPIQLLKELNEVRGLPHWDWEFH